MDRRIPEFSGAHKTPFSERFETVLPKFVLLLEGEWKHSNRLMSDEQQALIRQSHQALGRLNEIQDGAR